MLKVVVTDMDAYQQFVSKKLASLDNIGNVQSSFVMSEIKSAAAIYF
ncbi:MAG TPA: Lrp/AsnC ligand binding domain-containing protein [Saprospiraceae bacterium]|nr:Lrp/AsnC ligand binding domain-containing protein [Saprospiraceae bacterium]